MQAGFPFPSSGYRVRGVGLRFIGLGSRQLHPTMETLRMRGLGPARMIEPLDDGYLTQDILHHD